MNDRINSLYSALLANVGSPKEIGRGKAVRYPDFEIFLATFKRLYWKRESCIVIVPVRNYVYSIGYKEKI